MSSVLLKALGNTMDSMMIHVSYRPFLLTVALAIKVESLTPQGQLVAYESTLEKGGGDRELAFRPDGTAMKAD